MSYTLLHASYHPALVLAAGTLAFLGLVAVGSVIARAVRLRLPAPWNTIFAMLLGIQCAALVVEGSAMARDATRTLLLALAWTLLAAGCVELVRRARTLRLPSFRLQGSAAIAFGVVAAVALGAALIVALAPSTKADEIFYHMLAPARVVADGALKFYLEPREAAIWPHMTFQFALTPLYALGVPDAGNVVSWWLGAALVAFAWKIVRASGGGSAWAAAWAAALCVGLYPVVWRTTGGSHAMGDLALGAAVVAWLLRRQLVEQAGLTGFCALLGVVTLAAASSKVLFVPISLILVGAAVAATRPWSRSQGHARALAALLAPWVVFYAPILLWTTHASGSPFGPLLSWMVPHSAYSAYAARAILDDARAVSAHHVRAATVAFGLITDYSPLLWIGVVGAALCGAIRARDRVAMVALVAGQLLVTYWFAAPSARFLGGLPAGLATAFAALCAEPARRLGARLGTARVGVLALALLIPWAGAPVYYAAQFAPVDFGFESRDAFLSRYVAFFRDFEVLDRVLPADAVILARNLRLGAVYAPRPMFFDAADLPPGHPVFEFRVVTAEPGRGAAPLNGYTAGKSVYSNASAVVETYRTPGRKPAIGKLNVIALVPK